MMTNEEILNIRFKICENLEYKVDDHKIVTVLEKQDNKIQNFFRRLRFQIPMYKEIKFDEYSSEVFTQIDGSKTVKEIGENLELKYGDNIQPLYERLLVFLNHIDVNCKYIQRIE